MVASWISTVLHIVILCGSEIYIGSSANRLLYTILPVILKHPTPCIKTFLVKLSRVVCLPEETLTNFSHPTSISLKFYLPIDSNDVSIRIYQQACTCACSVKSDSLQPTKLLCPWIFQARILQWVAISFSRGSSRSRDRIHICWIGRQNLYHWAPWKALINKRQVQISHCAKCVQALWSSLGSRHGASHLRAQRLVERGSMQQGNYEVTQNEAAGSLIQPQQPSSILSLTGHLFKSRGQDGWKSLKL